MSKWTRAGQGMNHWPTAVNSAGRAERGERSAPRRERGGWGRRPEQDSLDETRDTLEDIRPKTRSDCREGIRPCPFLSCQYHALHAMVVTEDGTRPRLDMALIAKLDATNSCHLDVEEGLVEPFDK